MTGMNLPDETVWNYGYDYENRLVSVTDNADYTGAYTYSPDGLRLRVQESNNPNPDRWFQYDGVRPVLEGTLSDDTFTTVNRYVWEGGSYYDPLISASFGGSNGYYCYDGLGSTRQLLDSDEDVTDSYSYEAFGNILSDGGPTPNPYRYVGAFGYCQTGSPLQHLGARYYMPEVGRFIQRDPLRLWIDPYVYALNNPGTFFDPWGLWAFHIECYIGLGGGIAFGSNPGGGPFVRPRFGFGLGGGGGYSPGGSSPGWDPGLYPPYLPPALYASVGGFGELGFNIGPIDVGLLSGSGGGVFGPRPARGYGGFAGPDWGLGASWGVGASGSVGAEFSLFGP